MKAKRHITGRSKPRGARAVNGRRQNAVIRHVVRTGGAQPGFQR